MNHRPRVVMTPKLATELLQPNPLNLFEIYHSADQEQKTVSIRRVKLYNGKYYYLVIDTLSEQILVTETIQGHEDGSTTGGSSTTT